MASVIAATALLQVNTIASRSGNGDITRIASRYILERYIGFSPEFTLTLLSAVLLLRSGPFVESRGILAAWLEHRGSGRCLSE